MTKEKRYIDGEQICSAKLNLLIGDSGIGKTYTISQFMLLNYVVNKEKFIVCYYSEKAKEQNSVEFLYNQPDIIKKNFIVKGDYICFTGGGNNQVCGKFVSCRCGATNRGGGLSNVTYVLYDECLAGIGENARNINEIQMFERVVETYTRNNYKRIFLVGNPYSRTSSILSFFNCNDIMVDEERTQRVIFNKQKIKAKIYFSGIVNGERVFHSMQRMSPENIVPIKAIKSQYLRLTCRYVLFGVIFSLYDYLDEFIYVSIRQNNKTKKPTYASISNAEYDFLPYNKPKIWRLFELYGQHKLLFENIKTEIEFIGGLKNAKY